MRDLFAVVVWCAEVSAIVLIVSLVVGWGIGTFLARVNDRMAE